MPTDGGAASNQVQSFMFGCGRRPGSRTTSTRRWASTTRSCGGTRPQTGKGKILFDDGTGRFMYIDNAKRYNAGEWKKGEPKLFDPSNSISRVQRAARVRHGARLPVQGLPEHECELERAGVNWQVGT